MTNPYDAAQRIVLGTLLELHPALIGLGDLAGRLQLHGSETERAVRVLVEDGLAVRLGDRIGLTRAAIRFDVLSPIQSR